ncbi:MAG: hypothetical protein RIM68_12665 [Arenibacter sp.]
MTFDIFDYCCFEDTIISSFPIDENESVQLTEKVKLYILAKKRAGALTFESRRHNETDVSRFTNTDKKLIYKIMSKTPAVGGLRSGAGGLPMVFPNGSRTVNATGCPCSPGALKQQSPIK